MKQKEVVIGLAGFNLSTAAYKRKLAELVADRSDITVVSIELSNQLVRKYQLEGNFEVLKNCFALKISAYLPNVDFVVMCSHSLQGLVPSLIKETGKEFLSAANVIVREALDKKMSKVALVGTIATMESGYYTNALNKAGVEVVLPEKRRYIDEAIYERLGKGQFINSDILFFENIVDSAYEDQDVEHVILASTEIPRLLKDRNLLANTIDATGIHVQAAYERALEMLE